MNQMKTSPTSNAPVAIQLSAKSEIYSLGGEIPVTVHYTNRGGGGITFREPAKTKAVHLLVAHLKQEPIEVSLGRVFFYKSGDLERWTAEEAEKISLAPGATYEFSYDPGERWPELFVPGVNLMRIKDLTRDTEAVLSNTLEVKVVYDGTTFPRLLGILSDEKSTVDSRQFAKEWIKRVHPGFDMDRGGVGEGRIWWTKHKKDPQTIKRIEELNRETVTR
jgi:hypothetical protein